MCATAEEKKGRIMTKPLTIDELLFPVSLDGREGNDLRSTHALYNTVQLEGLGPAADLGTPAEMLD
jgi:hypothetical protein